MTQEPMSDAEIIAALIRGVKAQGRTTTERAQRMGYQRRRIEQFERGLFPVSLLKFAAAGVIAVNTFPDAPADAGK